MKKNYKVNKFFALLMCLFFNFLYPCKISRQLEFGLFSQNEHVVSSAISSSGENLVMSIKKFPGSFILSWNLQQDSAIQNYIVDSCKEIKFSQNDIYIGFNWGNRLDIRKIHDQNFESRFNVNQRGTCICGFDISENFDTVVYYDTDNNIYFYNLKNPTTPISMLKEPCTIRAVRFITQKTGRGFLAVETLYAIKFYDVFTCTLKHAYMIKDKTGDRFRSFCGICVDDGCYSAINSMTEDGRLETEIHLYPTDEEKTRKKYSKINVHSKLWVMDAPKCTSNPDVILFTGRKIYGSDIYEQVTLFSISENKYINFKLFKIEMDIAAYCKLLTPESLQNDSILLHNGRLLNAQFTSKNQLIIFLKSSPTVGINMTYAIFIDIDFNSPNPDFQVIYRKLNGKFYLAN
ncbi:MAG: hypothetical protein WCS92_05455 [Candidatus Babeliales bacterium]